MQSKATTVDDYLKDVPKDRLDALNKIRQLCLKELKGYDEVIMYGGPCYAKNNIPEAGFASQKNFIGFYILKKDVIDKYKGGLKNVSIGKGVIRFTNAKKIDFKVIQKMLKGTYESNNTICE